MASTRPRSPGSKLLDELGATEILAADPNAVLLVDPSGTIVHANAAATALTRYPAAILEGLALEALIPERWRRNGGDAHDAPGPEDPHVRREILPLERRDGTQLLVEASSSRLDLGGGLTFIVLVDVTAREAAQRRVRIMASVGTALSAAVSEEDVGRIVIDHVVDAFGASTGVVGVVNDDHLRLVASVGVPVEAMDHALVPVDADVPISVVVRSRDALVERGGGLEQSLGAAQLDRERQEPTLSPLLREALEGTDATFVVAVPLLVEGRAIGALSITFDHGEPPVDTLDFLETLAATAGQSLERARLFIRERAARDRAAALAALNGAVLEARSPTEVGTVLLDAAIPAFNATSGALWLVSPGGDALDLVESRGYESFPDAPHRSISLRSDRPAARAVRTGEGIRIGRPPADGDPTPEAGHADARQGAAAVVLPLVAPGRTIGALGLSFERPVPVGANDMAQLRGFADAGAAAIARSVADEQQRRTGRLFDAVIGQLPIGLLVAEAPSGRLLFANELVARMLGLDGGENGLRENVAAPTSIEIAYPDGHLVPPEERPIVRALSAGAAIEDSEMIVRRADGSRLVLLVSAAPVRDVDGRIVAAVSTFADISARAEALAARDAFIGILSHELRTPITTIYAGSRLLAAPSSDLDPGLRAELADDIATESERLRRLVEDLLVISRVEQGAELARSEPILVGHVVQAVVELERSRHPELRIDVRVEQGLPPASGDDGYVEQILHNLLSNAMKYGPPSGPIGVSVSGEPEWVVVRVADEGPGIVRGEEERVFDLFYRSPTTSRRATGAGIGLYTCRALVAAMGGEIWARRRDRGGTEIGFRLPVFDGD